MDSILDTASSIVVLETSGVLLAVLVAFFLPRACDRPFEPVEALWKKLAHRPLLSLVLVGAAPVVVRLALHPMLHTPQPWVHDEFSNVLAGDTFAHGRLTNPTHPLWKFFESFHILQHPVYASMYQPAQGLFLAAGKLLTGSFYAGALLSIGLLCAALLWMLRGWMPPEWALLGAMLAAIRIGLFSYWANSYWGGAPAAIGGALLAGSIPRILRSVPGAARVRAAVVLGVGLVLLAMSRPYEGLWFSIPFGIVFLAWLVRGAGFREKLLYAGAPLAAVLLAGGAALLYYNWRVTGNAFELPEMCNRRQYAIFRNMLWEKPRTVEPHYNNPDMRNFYVFMEPTLADVPHSALQLASVMERKGKMVFDFFLGPLLAVPLILAPAVLLRRQSRLLLAAVVSTAIGVACVRWKLNPHYVAPTTCAIYAFVIWCLRDTWTWQIRERPVGRFIVRGIFAVALILVMIRIFAGRLGVELPKDSWSWSVTWPGNPYRESMVRALDRMPSRFLVIVRYQPMHPPGQEWVFNEADIDNSKIVWARDFGPENEQLLKYFHDRRVLMIEPDLDPTVAYPYPNRQSPSSQ